MRIKKSIYHNNRAQVEFQAHPTSVSILIFIDATRDSDISK